MNSIEQLFSASVEAHQSGDLATAAKGYAAVLNASPEHADAWHLAGLVAHQSGRDQQGIQCIERAIDLRNDAEYFTNLAAIFHGQGKFEQAESLASRAIDIDPTFIAAHFRRGVALAALGRTNESLEHFQVALDADFAVDSTLQEVGNVYLAVGEMESAIKAFEVSLYVNPNQPNIYFSLGQLALAGKYHFSSEQIQSIEQLLRDMRGIPSLSARVARLEFALGHHFEQNQANHIAFDHYRKGNSQMAGDLNQQFADLQRQRDLQIERIHSLFSSHTAQAAPSAIAGSNPLFVVGLPRSGTSIATQILASHPEIDSVDEQTWLFDAINRLGVLDPPGDVSECSLQSIAAQIRDDYLANLRSQIGFAVCDRQDAG
ncbi:MAG: tetratricopeptide repeat protein [Pirellulaceae bacterium]